MAVHISDSAVFGNSWATSELRAVFDDTALLKGWIEVMVVLAETQAEFGLIPQASANDLADTFYSLDIDQAFLDQVRQGFEQSNHSLLGLIKALQVRSPGDSGEWWCYGATVQDITDTHNARVLKKVVESVHQKLKKLVGILCKLAEVHRNTAMCGRTHGQPGLPITFGFKVAGWLDEIVRHCLRLEEVSKRLTAGQLAGGVGSLSSLGPDALALQQCLFDKLGVSIPVISWTSSRDRLAEWLNLLALLSATADRIGHEIYNLQRPEIGELNEGFVAGTVGSITMPQKRNPEISEHLGTLARQVRYQAAQMNENLVYDHERDGRSWKSEWAIMPAACLATDKALALLLVLLENLQVNDIRMRENLLATKGFIHTEAVMLAVAPVLGKQSAHTLVYGLAMSATEQGMTLKEVLQKEPKINAILDQNTIARLFDLQHSTASCGQMVDNVLVEAKAWSG